MTRKDYVKLAGALAAAYAEADDYAIRQAEPHEAKMVRYGVEAAEVRISRILADDNPNFDRHRFHMAAIGQPVTGRDRP